MKRALGFVLALALAACGPATPYTGEDESAPGRPSAWARAGYAGPAGRPAKDFPDPDRPVAAIVSDTYSDEDTRERAGEADRVLTLAGIAPGMVVADIGAGSGYYTVRLATKVGPRGRVYAEDIVPAYLDRLRGRIGTSNFMNVVVALGDPHDPRLPPASLDAAFLVHMYHEIEQPYGLLWNLRGSLKPGALVVIVDADRPTQRHGTPPKLLDCELGAVGFARLGFNRLDGGSYAALYRAKGERPDPATIKSCRG